MSTEGPSCFWRSAWHAGSCCPGPVQEFDGIPVHEGLPCHLFWRADEEGLSCLMRSAFTAGSVARSYTWPAVSAGHECFQHSLPDAQCLPCREARHGAAHGLLQGEEHAGNGNEGKRLQHSNGSTVCSPPTQSCAACWPAWQAMLSASGGIPVALHMCFSSSRAVLMVMCSHPWHQRRHSIQQLLSCTAAVSPPQRLLHSCHRAARLGC